MIPKRIDRDSGSDNYRALALYVADAALGKTPGEKTLFSWYSGGLADVDDYWQGLEAVEMVQAMNQRSQVSKTYHLMVSFRPEDEDKLTKETLREIEDMLMSALGFDEHQRHSGVHQNTANLHLHIAVNMIHPQTYNRHSPYRDNYKLSRVCRAIEQKYGLAVDKGVEPDAPKQDGRANAKIKTIEAQTGQESLFSYVARHKAGIMAKLDSAKSWAEVHAAFLQYGLSLVPAGNGLKIKDRHGKHHVKPSAIDRQLGKCQLCSRFGPFTEASADLFRSIEPVETYSGLPIQMGAERDGLYVSFKEEMEQRRVALARVNQEGRRLYDECKSKWAEKRQAIRKIPLLRRDRERLREEIRRRELAELDQLRAETSRKRDAVRAAIPYTSWSKCLQHKAVQGNEIALAILRSKEKILTPEAVLTASPQDLDYPMTATEDQKGKINNKHGVSGRHRRALMSVLKMREVVEKLVWPNTDLKYAIDGKGTIIYSLPDGSRIRDSGQKIHFSPRSQQAKALALEYAAVRWGRQQLAQDGSAISLSISTRETSKKLDKTGSDRGR